MSDLEFLEAYHSASEDVRAFVDSVLERGQLSHDLLAKHCDTGRVILDPRYLYHQEVEREYRPYQVQ